MTNEYLKNWREKNADKVKAYRRNRYLRNREMAQKQARQWTKDNPERSAKNRLEWKSVNRHKMSAYEAKRRVAAKYGTPAWANLNNIQEIYRNCPEGFEVDHIIPLKSPLVCGLHVENNLQYLTKSENASKGNRL